jgi:outer membrane protein TolC
MALQAGETASRRRRPRGLLLMPVLGLAACVSMPSGGDAAFAIDGSKPESHETPRAPSAPKAAPPWWERFADPQLSALIEAALADSPQMALAAARVRDARLQVQVASAATYPVVAMNAFADRERESANGTIPPPFRGATLDNFRATLDFAYEFDFWDRNANLVRASTSQLAAGEADRDFAILVLSHAVAQAYWSYQFDLRRHEIAKRVETLRHELEDLSIRKVRSGLDSAVSQRQADTERAIARLNVAAIDTQLALERNLLAALLGKTDGGLAPQTYPARRKSGHRCRSMPWPPGRMSARRARAWTRQACKSGSPRRSCTPP